MKKSLEEGTMFRVETCCEIKIENSKVLKFLV